jgi:hypothetical protein
MNSDVIVVGAGMAGLLAANMLGNRVIAVHESAPSLPNNHNALLRFRSSIVSDATFIPFRPVEIIKDVKSTGLGKVADAVAYSVKSNGTASARSITSVNHGPSTRYIAPPDFIQRLEARVPSTIMYNSQYNFLALKKEGVKVISTIPMPSLMKALRYQKQPEFKYVHGYVATFELPVWVDAYATIYYPDYGDAHYRVSITGRKLIIEYTEMSLKEAGLVDESGNIDVETNIELIRENLASHFSIYRILNDFGINIVLKDIYDSLEVKSQQYAKIIPIDEEERKRFIMWASDNHKVYSVGRYATWRPGLLLDDVVNDVKVVASLFDKSSYSHRF